MFDFFKRFFRRFEKNKVERLNSGDAAKERLHSVLMQDRANVSADFIDLMKQDIIDDIKKYVDVDENEVDVRLASQIKNDGTNGAPIVYANIPITTVKSFSNNVKKTSKTTEVGSVIQSSNNNKNIENKNENSVKEDIKAEVVHANSVADSKQEEKNNKESAIDKKKAVKKVEPNKEEKKEETAEKKSATKKKVSADAKVDNKSKENKTAKENDNKELEEKAEVEKTAKTKKTTSVTKTSKVAKDEKVEEKKVKSTTRKTAVKK